MSISKKKRKFSNENAKSEEFDEEENKKRNQHLDINDDRSDNDDDENSINFGNVILKKKEWRVSFKCEECKELIEDFYEFLKHSLKHLYKIDCEAIQQLTIGLVKDLKLQETTLHNQIDDYGEAEGTLIESILSETDNVEDIDGTNIEKSYKKASPEYEQGNMMMGTLKPSPDEADLMELLYCDEVNDVDEDSINTKSKTEIGDIEEELLDDADFLQDSPSEEEFTNHNERIPPSSMKPINIVKKNSDTLNENEAKNNIFLEENCNSLEIEYVNETTFGESLSPKNNKRTMKSKSQSQPKPKSKSDSKRTTNHTNDYICHECGKTFHSKQALRNHERRHFAKYFCDMCDAVFNESVNLKVHRYRHLGIQPHKCDVCDKTFTTTTEVKLHMRSHTGEKPYKCDICNAAYATSSHLVTHRMRHSDVRPHACTYCDKNFYNKRELNIHIRTHTNERPFTCPSCDKTFKTHHALSQHKKLHLPFKSYKCEYCDREFAQVAGFRFHTKRCHEQQNLKTNDEDSLLSMSDIDNEEILDLVKEVGIDL